MNKNIFPVLLLLLLGMSISACDTAPAEGGDQTTATSDEQAPAQEVASTEEATAFDEQQEAFHTFMSGTFHPAEDDDLAPLREQHADMAAAAQKWAETEIPAKYADKGLDQQLSLLVAGAEEISTMVENNADDAELKQAITDLHDVFHGIMGACRDAEEHGMHEEHHGDAKQHKKHHGKEMH